MIYNIIKIALRNLYHSKFFSLINILGLSLGLTCSLLILTVVRQELSFDRFHEQVDHIFAIQSTMDLGTGTYTTDRCGSSVGPALVEAFPVITSCVRHTLPQEMLFTWYPEDTASAATGEWKNFIENTIVLADSNFLEFFSFPLLRGNPESALDDPYSLVMTESSAEKYFGDADPMGKIIRVNANYDLTVTAVLEDPPVTSSIQFDFLIPFRFFDVMGEDYEGFNGNPFNTFVYLDQPESAAGMDTTISTYLDQFQDGGMPVTQRLTRLRDYHRKGETKGQVMIIVLSIIALIIITIACINFMNMSTARYLRRTIEVGIRKVVGARRGQLIRQFIGETMIITFISINLSILAVDWLLPEFNRAFELHIDFGLDDPLILGGLACMFVITSLVAGSYPAFFLSSFKAVTVLRKVTVNSNKGFGIRKVLVVTQFLFAIVFIIVSVVNYRQVKLLNESMEGIDSSNIIYFPVRGSLYEKYPLFRQEVLQHPQVQSVATSDFVPKSVDRGEVSWGLEEDATNDLAMTCPAGYGYPATFAMDIEEGRFYSEEMPSDSAGAIVINHAVADALRLKDPVGMKFYMFGEPHTIIGVMRNYNHNVLRLAGDKVIYPFEEVGDLAFVKTAGGDRTAVREYIESVHEEFNPEYPFDYYYLDEYEDPLYEVAGIIVKMIFIFTSFGIFISYLGLFGLSVFSTGQRTKEIGIRKAMGASNAKVLRLVVVDFLKLILISLIIAIPLSIILMNMMLRIFADKVAMGPGLFLFTALIVITLALLTVGYHALKLSWSNPAENLRYE
jgi:putative ABC transport system permease protein